MTRPLHFALVGENVHYSQSPRIFEAIFKLTDLEGRFDLVSVGRDQLGDAVAQLVSGGAVGFSVTIPHKQGVFEFLDEVDPIAQSLQAVNSVAINDGQRIGYNTDVFGVTQALKRASFSPGDGEAMIFGNGGAARAVVHALYHDFGMRRFTICGRTSAGLQAFEQDLGRTLTSIQITGVAGQDKQLALDCDPSLLVNCTPLGGANHPEAVPFSPEQDWSGLQCYFDLNYNEDNRALSFMRGLSVPVVDGSVMLVAQALKSFEIWTGRRIDFEPIYREVFGAKG